MRWNPTFGGAEGAPRRMTDVDLLLALRTGANVLLTGPTTVALALAQRIHRESGWRYGPFTVIDCRHRDGLEDRIADAFRGAVVASEGPSARLLQAGTVLLQEIGDASRPLQSRLADDLEALRKRGRSRCRVLASTSRSLLPRVLDGTFDDRLFYRLNVLHLFPPDEPGSAKAAEDDA